MSRLSLSLRTWATPRQLALPIAAVAVVLVMPLATQSANPSGEAAWTPMSPVNVSFAEAQAAVGPTVTAGLLGINDFHGAIDKPTGSAGNINGVPAGGAEYLATTVKELRAAHQKAGRPVVTVGAGDLIGATPLVSAAFHDEPTIEQMNNLGLNLSSVGNHEFDEGTTELRRMQRGGCHPVDGCQDGDPFNGANFQYLSANVVNKNTGAPFFPAYQVRSIGGVKVGFIGMTLEGTPAIVNPAGITKVKFLDEVETANKYVRQLRNQQGVKAFVLLIHQGGVQNPATPPADPSSCDTFAGDITPIVAGLDPAIGVVVSGHTHQFYSCALPNRSGAKSLVTSAGSNGRLVTDITMTLGKASGRFVAASAYNMTVTNSNPARIDPGAKAIADKYRTAVAPIANRVVGSISADILRTPNAAGETPLGDVIADGMLAYTTGAGAQLAFMNPGGIRTDLLYAQISGGEAAGQVTYGEAFTVQPFNNLVVTITLTGAQIKAILEQQVFPPTGTPASATNSRILQVSNGFTYSYDSSQPAGSRISNMMLNGTPVGDATSYRVSTNDFLANGGDGFTNFTVGTDRATAPGFDVDALAAYLGTGPIAPGPVNRITRIA